MLLLCLPLMCAEEIILYWELMDELKGKMCQVGKSFNGFCELCWDIKKLFLKKKIQRFTGKYFFKFEDSNPYFFLNILSFKLHTLNLNKMINLNIGS